MEDWKEAFWLTKFHFRKSITPVFILFVLFGFLLIFLLMRGIISSNNSNNLFTGLDIFFFLLFIFILPSLKPGNNTTIEIGNHHQASPYIIGLNQLPIKKSVIMKHRFLTSLFLSIPFQILLLLNLYFLTPTLQEELAIGTYLVFALIWICLSVFIGPAFIALDVGHRFKTWMLIFFALFAFNLIIFIVEAGPSLEITWNFKFPPSTEQPLFSVEWGEVRGIVNWTLLFAQKQPLLSSGISILLAIVGWKFWMNQMLKKMNRVDYL